jgi:hypothetical protein
MKKGSQKEMIELTVPAWIAKSKEAHSSAIVVEEISPEAPSQQAKITSSGLEIRSRKSQRMGIRTLGNISRQFHLKHNLRKMRCEERWVQTDSRSMSTLDA